MIHLLRSTANDLNNFFDAVNVIYRFPRESREYRDKSEQPFDVVPRFSFDFRGIGWAVSSVAWMNN